MQRILDLSFSPSNCLNSLVLVDLEWKAAILCIQLLLYIRFWAFLLSFWQLCDWQGVSALLEAFCLIANDNYHGRIQRDFSALQVYGWYIAQGQLLLISGTAYILLRPVLIHFFWILYQIAHRHAILLIAGWRAWVWHYEKWRRKCDGGS